MGCLRNLGVLFLAVFSSIAFAQSFPSKPVQVIISFTPGSATDIVGRLVTAKLSEYWGQPVIPENRSGAGGSIGSAVVARAAPDGYTLLINSSAHTVNPAIFAKLPYDTVKDFTDIAPLAVQPNVLIVNAATSPHKTLMDVINFAKANPGRLNFGHAGVGSGTHLNTEKLLARAGAKATVVPFKGTPEVVQAVLAGAVDTYWVPISAGIANIKAGKLRALAVSTAKRAPALPDVPTTGEAGVKGADTPLWFGLWGPAGLPDAIVAKLNADVRKALADPGVRDKLTNLGNDTLDLSAAEFAKFVREEIAENRRVLEAVGVKPQ